MPLAEIEVLQKLIKGPFLLTEGVIDSPFYQVIPTQAGPAVFMTKGFGRMVKARRLTQGGAKLVRDLLIRFIKEEAERRGIAFFEKLSLLALVKEGKRLTVMVEPSKIGPLEGELMVISTRKPRRGRWVPLVPGCYKDILEILDLHFGSQAANQGPSAS